MKDFLIDRLKKNNFFKNIWEEAMDEGHIVSEFTKGAQYEFKVFELRNEKRKSPERVYNKYQ